MLINQVVAHFRWKEELNRKGEDKYLEKRLEVLYSSLSELYMLSEEILDLKETGKELSLLHYRNRFQNIGAKLIFLISNLAPFTTSEQDVFSKQIRSNMMRIYVNNHEDDANSDEQKLFELDLLMKEVDLYRSSITLLLKSKYSKPSKRREKWIILTLSLINILLIIYLLSS